MRVVARPVWVYCSPVLPWFDSINLIGAQLTAAVLLFAEVEQRGVPTVA